MNYDKKENTLGNSLKSIRQRCDFSRREVSEKIGVSEETVKSWERGRRIPSLECLLSLAQLYSVTVTHLTGELDMLFSPINHFFKGLSLCNPQLAYPSVYYDIDQVLSGYELFSEQKEVIADVKFLFLIDVNTSHIWGIYDVGRFSYDIEKIIFSTDFLPFRLAGLPSQRQILASGRYTLRNFKKEVENMKNASAYPLFLLRYIKKNRYITWSLSEKKVVVIDKYKIYTHDFMIFDSEKNAWMKNQKYTITPPSDDLIDEIGLPLISIFWKKSQEWDEWYSRPKRLPSPLVNLDEVSPTYLLAINLANKGRMTDYGCSKDFFYLEKELDRLEKMLEVDVPESIIKTQEKRLENVIAKVNVKNS